MSYECFLCPRNSLGTERSLYQHLNDAHDWLSENDRLNENFYTYSRCCPYCRKNVTNFNGFLYHVLNCCPSTEKSYLYWNRHDEVLSVFREAVRECFPDPDWKIVSVLENTYYTLPLGIKNGDRSPDILVYSRMRKVAVIIELSVPWESNMPRAGLVAQSRMRAWSTQFKQRGYDCSCYNVEVGSRGLVSNSFEYCLECLDLDEGTISYYSQLCSDTAVRCSQNILQGKPWGDDDYSSSSSSYYDDY